MDAKQSPPWRVASCGAPRCIWPPGRKDLPLTVTTTATTDKIEVNDSMLLLVLGFEDRNEQWMIWEPSYPSSIPESVPLNGGSSGTFRDPLVNVLILKSIAVGAQFEANLTSTIYHTCQWSWPTKNHTGDGRYSASILQQRLAERKAQP